MLSGSLRKLRFLVSATQKYRPAPKELVCIFTRAATGNRTRITGTTNRSNDRYTMVAICFFNPLHSSSIQPEGPKQYQIVVRMRIREGAGCIIQRVLESEMQATRWCCFGPSGHKPE
jgi:hypothetical protein